MVAKFYKAEKFEVSKGYTTIMHRQKLIDQQVSHPKRLEDGISQREQSTKQYYSLQLCNKHHSHQGYSTM